MISITDLVSTWRTDLSRVDAALCIRELVSRNILTMDRIKMAASLGSSLAGFFMVVKAGEGDQRAIAWTKERPPLPDYHRKRLEVALALLDVSEKVQFATDCALRVFPYWQREVQNDSSGSIAIEIIQAYSAGIKAALPEVEKVLHQLQQSADRLDDPEKEMHKSPALVAAHTALCAVAAVLSAIKIAQTAQSTCSSPPVVTVEHSCSDAASCAVNARVAEARFESPSTTLDSLWLVEKAEESWQIQRLFNYLLKRLH